MRRVELLWTAEPQRRPKPEEVVVTYFDAETRVTSPPGGTRRSFAKPTKRWCPPTDETMPSPFPWTRSVWLSACAGSRMPSAYEVPTVRVFTPERWKRMDLEIEWGFDKVAGAADYSGRIEAYDGIVAGVQPLAGDAGTTMKDACHWVRCRQPMAGKGCV